MFHTDPNIVKLDDHRERCTVLGCKAIAATTVTYIHETDGSEIHKAFCQLHAPDFAKQSDSAR